ncbi:unnamed protein product [Caenorhabditis angaria]|uniref:Uncharacterized protein n=1 Tax=Caenorhabditis angaria TaxID=860376 RepID=A0A9P1I8Q7_9PELO|nr:unnamed protein product [Caenorhabditis angaria]
MPYEMRNMIIDLMDIQTTTRFSQCSIDCYEEVGKSLNFIDEIKIDQKDNFGSCVVFDLKKKDSIEKLSICDWSIGVDFPYNRSKIGYLPNLEELRRLSPHLKKRDCCEIIDPIDCKFIEFNQICKIRKYLSIPRLSLSYVLHLTAEKIYIAYVTSAPLIFRDFLHFIPKC